MPRQHDLTDAELNRIYDVLVDCGAAEGDRDAFKRHWPDCVEYRFVGALGFGGKLWANSGRVYVTCYREDETPERLAFIEGANADLEVFAGRIR